MEQPTLNCAECGTPFQRTQPQRRFCTRTCKQRRAIREWMRRKRAADPERTKAERHADYEANKAHVLAVNAEWRRSHPAASRAIRQRYYRTHQALSWQRTKRWLKAHPEYIRAKSRRWRAKHPERVQAAWDRYAAANPERRRLQKLLKGQRRRAAQAAAPRNDFTAEQWLSIKAAYDQRCAYCGKKKTLTVDHVQPISKGGAHTAGNIVPACASCNSAKRDRPPPKPIQLHLG